jgi:predicted SAM-dependent methyltransferase
MDILEFKNKKYPSFQKNGYASQFAIPFAKYFCIGEGYDIGCNKKEWAFPNSIPIDISFNDGFNALNLPKKNIDYIYSSHCLEHLDDWVQAMDYWYEILKNGGILFLYLPDFSQEYWRPWNNYKHKHVFIPEIIKEYMIDKKYKNIFCSGIDLNNSFMIVGEK